MYILACDERGTIFRNSRSRSWTFGGFIFKLQNINELINKWNEIKNRICGSDKVELKWSHFFASYENNPIIDKPESEKQLFWALEKIFEGGFIEAPITTRISKDKASDICYRISTKGNEVLDVEIHSVSIYAQFALFLKVVDGTGEIWMDNLGSIEEQNRKQAQWIELRDNNINEENREITKRINREIKFFDSKHEPIIQIADFVSGVIWSASEGDEKYLIERLDNYFPDWRSKINLLTIC